MAVVAGMDLCAEVASNRASERTVRPLYFSLQDAERTALRSLEESWTALRSLPPTESRPTTFTFDERPEISLEAWLLELHAATTPEASPPQFLEARRGSHLELFLLAPTTLATVLITLGFVERIVDRLVRIRARADLLLAPTLPAEVRRRALQPLPETSAGLLRELRSCMALLADPNSQHLIAGAHAVAKTLRGIDVEA